MQQEESSSWHAERVFLLLVKHQEALRKSVMLGPASLTSWVVQNVHDKPRLFQTQTYLHEIDAHNEEQEQLQLCLPRRNVMQSVDEDIYNNKAFPRSQIVDPQR